MLAPISEGMDVKENVAHYKRLLFYKGIMEEREISPGSNADEREIVTLGYGIANWYLVEGDVDKAIELFSQVVESRYWPALPFIAAEAELIRKPQLKKTGTPP